MTVGRRELGERASASCTHCRFHVSYGWATSKMSGRDEFEQSIQKHIQDTEHIVRESWTGKRTWFPQDDDG